MNIDSYQEGVLRTEGEPDEPMKRWYVNPNQSFLLSLCLKLEPLMKDADALKKHVYYGKDLVISNLNPYFNPEEFTCGPEQTRRIHSVLGLLTEVGELLEKLKAEVFEGAVFDKEAWLKEFGDVGWYLGLGADSIGDKLSHCCQVNLDKLKRRYPEKFDEDLARGHDGE